MNRTDVVFDILAGDGIAAEDHQALHHIAELADVSGPGLLLKHRKGLGRECLDRHPGLSADLIDKIFSEKRDVGLSFVQRRDLDHDHAEAMVKVFPEVAFGDLVLKVLVGGGHDPHIDYDVLVAADP